MKLKRNYSSHKYKKRRSERQLKFYRLYTDVNKLSSKLKSQYYKDAPEAGEKVK